MLLKNAIVIFALLTCTLYGKKETPHQQEIKKMTHDTQKFKMNIEKIIDHLQNDVVVSQLYEVLHELDEIELNLDASEVNLFSEKKSTEQIAEKFKKIIDQLTIEEQQFILNDHI